MRTMKYMFTLCVFLLLAMFANGAYFLLQPEDAKPRNEPAPISYYQSESTKGIISEHSESSISEELPVNTLVLGLDAEGTRSDVILLLNFDPGLSRLNILSIARDTLVRIDGRRYKINALYSKGGELLLADKISEITGLPVHYYVTMNFKGFRKIVDTLGGVRFDVPFRMNYDDPTQNLHIHLKKGMQLLDGKKAEQLVRYRKGNYKGQGYTEGDIGRIGMQQDFIKAMIVQKLSLKYLSRVDELFDIMQEYVKTNVAVSDIAQYIGSMKKIKNDEIKAVTLPGTSKFTNGVWYFILNDDETAKIIESSFYK
jgi:polyisoprenyl-teichoic acid--peptidoglycan teichoic acid transferase